MRIEWPILAALLCASSFCSASETAMFALDDAGRARAGASVRALLADARALLVTLLLSNLLVNVLFFSIAARLAPEGYGEIVAGGIALFVLVAFGEILPKALALRGGPAFARLAARPVALLVAATSPVRRVIELSLELCVRALGPAAREERGIDAEHLFALVDSSAQSGVLDAAEADLVAEILELEGIRVREIMTPRVDMLAIDLLDEDEQHVWFTIARALAKRLTWLPVVRGHADDVAGCVRLREVLASPDRAIAELVRPVPFVPEVGSAIELLHVLRDMRATEAVVVDEHGGTAGTVTIESVFEELVGDLRVEGEPPEPPVTRLSDGRLRVSGGLSIRDWNERLGREVVPAGFETVGGFVAALLGRIPRVGDRVETEGLVAEVREVRGRRVTSVDLWPRAERAK